MNERPFLDYAGEHPNYEDPPPAFADIMTLEDFRSRVECGAFVRSDGSAHFINKDGLEDDSCYGWEWDTQFPADAVKVAWYNR